ncbi:putative calmodulin-domain protein kinase, partial [Gregarina niphandrodes]
LYEIYTDGYTVYLILELCEGGQLFDRIVEHYERQRRAITEQQVAAWMTELLSAVAYCHSKAIVHRDIKPENILFVDGSECAPLKLIDFGLSSSLEKIRETQHEEVARKGGVPGMLAKMMPKIGGKPLVSTNTKKLKMQRAGTPHYMAPEMIRGAYDCKCDLFSVGVIMHQMLSGVHPYYVPGVDDEKSVEVKILETIPPLTGPEWSFVSPAAKDLCRSLLRRTPTKRLSAREALQHAWFELVKANTSTPSIVSMSVFDGLRNWQNENKVKQAVVQLIARELSEKEICDLRRKFKTLDKEHDGMISLEEVREAMREAGHDVVESDLAAIFKGLADGVAGRIGWNEFLAALLCKRMTFQENQLREIFKKLDTNNEGKISANVLKTALRGTQKINNEQFEDDLEKISPDGFIDFYDFVAMMTPEQFNET